MPYSDFTLRELKLSFGLSSQRGVLVPASVAPLKMSNTLREDLEMAGKMLVRSEKAKSEWVVTPILKELLRNNSYFFTVYSGEMLVADKERGLVGECDFILGKNVPDIDIALPIFTLVEAKKNDVEQGIAQCAAQMLGAQTYNAQSGIYLPAIWGCVTTADEWLFMRLTGTELQIEQRKFYFSEVEIVLGVFQHILDFYRLELQKLS